MAMASDEKTEMHLLERMYTHRGATAATLATHIAAPATLVRRDDEGKRVGMRHVDRRRRRSHRVPECGEETRHDLQGTVMI